MSFFNHSGEAVIVYKDYDDVVKQQQVACKSYAVFYYHDMSIQIPVWSERTGKHYYPSYPTRKVLYIFNVKPYKYLEDAPPY